MLDFWKTIAYALTGAFADHKDLRKGFWAFLFVVALSIVALTYNAFMSYSFYLNWLDQLAFSEQVAVGITVFIATGIFFLMSYVCGFIIDIWRYGESESSKIGVGLATTILVATIGWDIYANLQGVDPISEQSTQTIMENQSESVQNPYNQQIQAQEDRITAVLKKYTWRGNTYFRPTKYHPLSEWKQDTSEVNAAKREIRRLESLRGTAVEQALDDYKRDKNRFDTSVNRKQVAHRGLVKFVYLLTFLFALFAAFYMDEAINYVLFMKKSGFYDHKQSIFARFQQYTKGHKRQKTAFSSSKYSPIGYKQSQNTDNVKNAQFSDTTQPQKEAQKKPLTPEKGDNFHALMQELQELSRQLKSSQNEKPIDHKGDENSSKKVPQGKQFSSTYQPENRGPRRHGKRIDGMESRAIIKATYLTLKQEGKKATYAAISEITGISQRTVGNHIREMKREGVIGV